jgi:hypothetical protein
VQEVEYEHLGTRERRVKIGLILFTHLVGYDILPAC